MAGTSPSAPCGTTAILRTADATLHLVAYFRVTAAPLWMQAVIAPAVQAFHAAFLEVEFKQRTAAWREGLPLLADARSDQQCSRLVSGEALPAHLQRERFLEATTGIVVESGDPLQCGTIRPRNLAR